MSILKGTCGSVPCGVETWSWTPSFHDRIMKNNVYNQKESKIVRWLLNMEINFRNTENICL